MPTNDLTGYIEVNTNWSMTGPSTGRQPRSAADSVKKRIAWLTNGVGAGQCDELYSAVLTIVGAGTNNLDLSGALANVLGDTGITFARIKAGLIWLRSTSDTTPDGIVGTACSGITVGGAAANPWVGPMGGTGAHSIRNGGHYSFGDPGATGWVVTAGTGDVYKIINNDAVISAIVDITLWGAKT